MSQPLPDHEEWTDPRGAESQESFTYSTKPYSQQLPCRSDWNELQYINEEHSQLENDNNPMDMGSLVKHQLDQPPTTEENANTTLSNAGLGNLIPHPHLGDLQQEVNNTFSFAQHDLRKSSQERRSGQEMSSTTAIASGSDHSNAQIPTQRISIPHPKASPVRTRASSIKKLSPVKAREIVRLAPAFSNTLLQRDEIINIRDQQGDFQEHHHMYHHHGPKNITSPGGIHSDGTEGRDEVIQSTHEEEEPLSQGAHPSAALQLSITKQHERQRESTNTGSSYAFVEKPSISPERPDDVFTEVPVSIPAPEGLIKQSLSESGSTSINNITPTRPEAKTRQPLGTEKSNTGLQVQASRTTRPSHSRPLEPSKHAHNAANPHPGRQRPEVTKNEGPGDLTFSLARQERPRPRQEPIDRALRQPSQVQSGRRHPATPAMTRPVRIEPAQIQPCRPLSSSSNVSKRRAPQPKSPQPNILGLDEYRDGVESELAALQEHIEVQKKDIEGYRDEIHTQSQVIDRTVAERDEWAAQAEQERKIAESSTSKVQKLHGKCQEFKNQLNAATEEHQRLYRRNREMILAAQKEHESRSERIQQENEKIRANIQASVIEVSREAHEQIAKLNEETSTLRVQLDERQKALSNEKDIAEGLRKELDQARLLLKQNVQTLASQNDKILETLKECTKDEFHENLSEQTHKLDTVLKSVEDVRVSNYGTITDLVQSLKNDFVKDMSSTIREEMTSKQPVTEADKEVLTAGIGSIQELCDHIYNQVRDDQHSQHIQYMYQESQHHLQTLEERLQETLEQWEQAESWNFEFGQANEELRAELVALGEENRGLQINADAIEALNDENCSLMEQIEKQQEQISVSSNLEDQVASLEATISSLQNEAEVSQYLEDQVACLEDQITEKDKMIKNSDKVSKQLEASLEKAVQRSKGTEQRIQDDRQQLQERLQSTEKERSRLEKDLATARERIQELSSARSAEETEMRNLRYKMEVQNVTIEEFTKEVQTTQQIQEQLKSSLKDWVKDYKEIEHMKKLFEQIDWSRMDNTGSAADFMEERIRRVVVQSPMPMIGEKVIEPPPSVEQERESRRQAIPPKSIMRVTRASARNTEALDDSAGSQPMPEKPLVSNHSMYNRPVQGATNDHLAHESLAASQKRARSSSVPSDTGRGNDVEHANKRGKSVDPTGTQSSNGIRPKFSQSMNYEPQDSEDEITEKDMSTRTFGGNLRGEPLPKRTSSLVTYGRENSDPYSTSQSSIASSQTMSQGSLGSQLSSALPRMEGSSQGQGQSQQRTLPFKHRFSKS
ncbi:hypothetical protein PG994_006410 [Apiospora phragmitis]|uniref:Uncharacterized protein n=1 Tax=Apiospora phragmitis TaxID=2905665 RepID=A0ABR1VEZ4_9PEZI